MWLRSCRLNLALQRHFYGLNHLHYITTSKGSATHTGTPCAVQKDDATCPHT